MKTLKKSRESKGLSQRKLASLASISYKSLQLVEGGTSDPRLSTLEHIATALGYPAHILKEEIEAIFELPVDAIKMISIKICREGGASWKIWLFNFVDAFRHHKTKEYIEVAPISKTPEKIKALLASTVEMLCEEMEIKTPEWCRGVSELSEPWFVSGVENLKAMALVESPVHFRKRNIFVLENFLKRA
ncbi:MAG: helix-turn-helix transcriptional regulator [Deltaproteobacteria bacterium]|nr:helix-turn-helix transcriptional regulator [Deltaproteobacteria bacterium]